MLSRVSGILAGRGFNIESLVVCRTEIRDLSRMTIVLKGQDGVVEQARRQLEDLVSSLANGWRVYDPGLTLQNRCLCGLSWITPKPDASSESCCS